MRLWHTALFEEAGGDAGGTGGGSTLLSGGVPPAGNRPAGGEGAAPPAAASPWLKDESGAFADGWQSRLDGEFKDHPSLKAIGDLKSLVGSYVATKSLVGKKLEAPGEGATPEQIASWRKTVGAPDKPEGYLGDAKTFKPEDVPDSMWDAGEEKAFLELAHKHHLSAAAVKDIFAFRAGSLGKALEASSAQSQQYLASQVTELKNSWGSEFNANLETAKAAAKVAGMSLDHPAFTDAAVVQAFAKLGKMFGETSLVSGDAPNGGSGIESRIKEIQDPQSTAMLAREYRGEFGPERQTQAATTLRDLLKAREAK